MMSSTADRIVGRLMIVLWLLQAQAKGDFQGATHMMPFDEGSINYSKTPDSGPIAQLQAQLDAGKASLKFDESSGYLRDLLAHLGISEKSQMLVFSKTSFQRERIGPRSPRALYFNDNVYIGFIPGAPLLEVSAVDPSLGGVFYSLEQKPQTRPRFVRTDQCLECHASAKSMGVPGHLVRSFTTDEEGVVDLITGISQVNHRTPLNERWGGWYVTGTHGQQLHRGNLIGKSAFERQEKEPNYLGNVTDLSRFFDTSRYLAPHSDIAALMVFEHQTHMHNFITRIHYAAQLSLEQYGEIKYLNTVIESFLKYLLFTEEIPLKEAIHGTSGFTDWFPKQGPNDKSGRSLRDFDLQTRLFKYPCSYLIYSDAFEQLPTPLKDRIFRRLWEILSGRDQTPAYDTLSEESRRAILEILKDTLPSVPDYWSQAKSVKTLEH